ncbi:MAG: ABC transporter permease subunit [Haloarculaceae archaeon]
MSWVAVTKKDYRDAIRSPYFWGVTGGITLIVGIFLFQIVQRLLDVVAQAQQQGVQVQLTTDLFVTTLRVGFQVLVPVLAIVVAYTSIAGERDSGTLKLLLSLPNTRRDVLVGKLVGRSAVVATPILVAFAVGAVIFPFSQFTFVPETYLAFAALTLLLGIVFVALALGVSAAVRSSRRAAVGSFGVFAYLVFLWNGLSRNLPSLLARVFDMKQTTQLRLEVFLHLLNPMAAYHSLVYSTSASDATVAKARAILITRAGGTSPAAQSQAASATAQVRAVLLQRVFTNGVPWYFSDPMVVVYLLLWLVVPLVLGYLLFERSDL